jgi:hypothetical protein
MAMEAAKEQLGKDEQTKGLPERQLWKCKYLGHQNVPEFFDNKTPDGDSSYYTHHRFDCSGSSKSTHKVLLH